MDDTATGLTHIGAREYDQNSGRFLSADPVIDITDPLQINGYTYARNSPVSTSDPDGLRPVGVCEMGGCPPGTKEWFTQDDKGHWTQHMVQQKTTSRSDGSTCSPTRTPPALQGQDLCHGRQVRHLQRHRPAGREPPQAAGEGPVQLLRLRHRPGGPVQG
ncbi:hypothetical protein C3492_36440 [Streptomyces sp. Ru62]|nr:hypothetical protein C3492_36440 [Streptomyces sp. Ru62]